jgi:hypothetical protein
MRLGRLSVASVAVIAGLAITWTEWDQRPDGPRPTPAQLEVAQRAVADKVARLEERGPRGFDAPAEAQRFFAEQRLAEGERRLPIEHLRRQYDDILLREELDAGLDGPGPGGVLGWSWLGPGNIGGRTRALVIDPNAPEVMYAAGVAGGIWKSVDGGASWNSVDDFMLNLAVCSLVIDPTDSNVLYAGTGEGYYFSSSFVEGLGIFKSVDAGATWTQLPGTVSGIGAGAFSYVNDIVISPNNANRIYAATRTGVWRSKDAGATWAPVLANPSYLGTTPATNGCIVGCTDLEIRPGVQPDTLFAAFGSAQADGLWLSVNNGNDWVGYSVPASQGRMALRFAPSDNNVLYLLMADNGSGGSLGQLINLYRSDDAGGNFVGQVDFGTLMGPWLLNNLIVATGCFSYMNYAQGWYDLLLAVDPADEDIVWVGGVDIFRSDDGGVNWGSAGYSAFYQSFPAPTYQIHGDHHSMVFHPNYDGATNQTAFATNDGGLFKTENARAATSQEACPINPTLPFPAIEWQRLNNGYGVTQFYHGDAARHGDIYLAGAQDNGSNRALSANAPNGWELVFGGDGGYCAIDPRDGDVMYLEYHTFPSIHKSVDGGETFVESTSGITDTDGVFIPPFAMDESNPDILWAGGSRPWRTTDGAANWTLGGPDLTGPGRITAIGIAPSDSNVVYLGYENGYVTRSTNALAPSPTWTIFTEGLYASWVSSLAVHPDDPDRAYLTYSNYGAAHILKTEDGGQNWVSIDGIGFEGYPDIPAHWIAIRPCHPEQLYVGSELGVFASQDGGATWNPSNEGLAHTVVEALDFKDADTLVAFTHGRGAFETKLVRCKPGTSIGKKRHAGASGLPPIK